MHVAMIVVATVLSWFTATGPVAAGQLTAEAPMMRADSDATGNGWTTRALFTVGERIGEYRPPGVLDGVGAFATVSGTVLVLVNHELAADDGYAYRLANGTQLTGARVSLFEFEADGTIAKAGLAYDAVHDRTGTVVTDPGQINETGSGRDGFSRFCSGRGVAAGELGFVDDIFFAGEEVNRPAHPHGGTVWALNVHGREIHALPVLGRGAWENVTPVRPPSDAEVALLLGDDAPGAPLYLYLGEKAGAGDATFLQRNGLEKGRLYCWRSANGDLDPGRFNGFNASREGTFVAIDVKAAGRRDQPGVDSEGYLDAETLRAQADERGCFSFSRPEDLHNDPNDARRVVFASTGHGDLFPSDNWGTLYLVVTDPAKLSATITVLHDADDLPVPDQGIRSPDNVTWGRDGYLYVQEDRSTTPSTLFGSARGVESSLWKVSPASGDFVRIAEIDRGSGASPQVTDARGDGIGDWESSGVVDVTGLFAGDAHETLLLGTVQAHGTRAGARDGEQPLVEGGQLILFRNGH